jgi:predicted transcriptional regulator
VGVALISVNNRMRKMRMTSKMTPLIDSNRYIWGRINRSDFLERIDMHPNSTTLIWTSTVQVPTDWDFHNKLINPIHTTISNQNDFLKRQSVFESNWG